MISLKYKIYKSQKNKRLDDLCTTACHIWNHCISLQNRYYKLFGKHIPISDIKSHIAKIRKRNIEWKALNSQSVQEVIERVDIAYQRFFKKLAKRSPRYKKEIEFKSIVFKQTGYSISGNRLTINKIGGFKFSKSREYEKIKRICIKKDNVGDFYLIMCCDIEPNKYEREGYSSIGMDFGLKHYITLNTGDKIDSPLFYKEKRKTISSKNREYSLKKVKSKGKSKAKNNLCKEHRKIANLRLNHHWSLAHQLCKEHSLICIEDLNISAMKKMWGRKISDISFSSFIEILGQCAKKYGTIIQKVDRFYPSSKLCRCGYKNDSLRLTDRLWTCPCCGETHDRDVLAANNILGEGIRLVLRENKTGLLSQS